MGDRHGKYRPKESSINSLSGMLHVHELFMYVLHNYYTIVS